MSQNDIIVIVAAGAGTWLRERFTPSGWTRMFGEQFIPEYKEKMELLRQVDDQIHQWAKELDYFVKEMRKASNANRLIDVAILGNELRLRLGEIVQEGQKVQDLTEEAVKEFDLEHQLPLEEKTAGAWDDFKREWVSKRLENKKRQARTLAVRKLVDNAGVTVERVKGYVKQLGKARARGKIGEYLQVLNSISGAQFSFAKNYISVYDMYLKPLVEQVKPPVQEVPVTETLPETQMEPEPMTVQLPQPEPMTLPEPMTVKLPEENSPETVRSNMIEEVTADGLEQPDKTVERSVIQAQHENFIKELKKLGTADLMALALVKYSEVLEDIDSDASLKLLVIAEGILNG